MPLSSARNASDGPSGKENVLISGKIRKSAAPKLKTRKT